MTKIAVMSYNGATNTHKLVGFVEREVTEIETLVSRQKGAPMMQSTVKTVKLVEDSEKVWQVMGHYLVDLNRDEEVLFPTVVVSRVYLKENEERLGMFQEGMIQR